MHWLPECWTKIWTNPPWGWSGKREKSDWGANQPTNKHPKDTVMKLDSKSCSHRGDWSVNGHLWVSRTNTDPAFRYRNCLCGRNHFMKGKKSNSATKAICHNSCHLQALLGIPTLVPALQLGSPLPHWGTSCCCFFNFRMQALYLLSMFLHIRDFKILKQLKNC